MRKPVPIRFLLSVVAFAVRGFRHLLTRLMTPGAGPFLAGC
jgi:hypothetical protein